MLGSVLGWPLGSVLGSAEGGRGGRGDRQRGRSLGGRETPAAATTVMTPASVAAGTVTSAVKGTSVIGWRPCRLDGVGVQVRLAGRTEVTVTILPASVV